MPDIQVSVKVFGIRLVLWEKKNNFEEFFFWQTRADSFTQNMDTRWWQGRKVVEMGGSEVYEKSESRDQP